MNNKRIAQLLRERARELRELADDLDGEAKPEESKPKRATRPKTVRVGARALERAERRRQELGIGND